MSNNGGLTTWRHWAIVDPMSAPIVKALLNIGYQCETTMADIGTIVEDRVPTSGTNVRQQWPTLVPLFGASSNIGYQCVTTMADIGTIVWGQIQHWVPMCNNNGRHWYHCLGMSKIGYQCEPTLADIGTNV